MGLRHPVSKDAKRDSEKVTCVHQKRPVCICKRALYTSEEIKRDEKRLRESDVCIWDLVSRGSLSLLIKKDVISNLKKIQANRASSRATWRFLTA